MSGNRASESDWDFVRQFEACQVSDSHFDHKAHIRLAYTYLCEHDLDATLSRVRSALHRFLEHLRVPIASKYHETMTSAWTQIVRAEMERHPESASAEEFIRSNAMLGHAETLLSYYSKELIDSDAARASFVEPDLMPLPR